MTTATIISQTSGNSYVLYFNSKQQAIGCSCASRKFNPGTPCKHMTATQRNSCILCGKDTKNTICGRCTE